MRIIPGLALVLSGGAYKVMSQIPPVVFLEQHNVYPQEITAISGGGPQALALMMGKAKNLAGIWQRVVPRKFYRVGWRSLLWSPPLHWQMPLFDAEAILQSRFLTKIIDEEVDFDFIVDHSPIKLNVGVMDLKHAAVQWFSNHDPGMTTEFFRAVVLASMRIPVFFAPVEFDGHQWVDLGLRINLPLKKVVRDGFRKIIAFSAVPLRLGEITAVKTWPEIDIRFTDIAHADELAEVQEFLAERGLTSNDVCLIWPPSRLSIFQKKGSDKYGSPSAEARMELLGAGAQATLDVLAPFLQTQGLIGTYEDSFFDVYARLFAEAEAKSKSRFAK